MSISCQSLYGDVCQQLGLGTGNEKLASAFVRAVNRALDQLSVKVDLATKHGHISSVNGVVSTLSSNYEYILYSGVLYWLVRQGFTNSDPRVATVQYRDSEDAWKEAKADYKEDLDNIDQSSDSVNMIGLGSPDNY
jgi:hypothetical protein